MGKRLLILVFASIMTLLMASAAFAAHSGAGAFGDSDRKGAATAGLTSFTDAYSTGCVACHENSDKHAAGPHGGYTASTNKCQTCHDVHAVKGNAMLLGGTTLTQACNFCHDLTGTEAGPFNKTNGMAVAAAHRVGDIDFGAYKPGAGTANAGKLDEYSWEDKAAITQIPGGDAQTLGNSTLNAYVQGQLSGTQYFTCDSCHTPHGVNTVNRYLGESGVKQTTYKLPAGQMKIYQTNRLLKNKPNDNWQTVAQYGSEWCLTCHAGRDDTYGGIDSKHNHPVDETAPAYRFLQYAFDDGKFLNGKNPATVANQAYVLIDTNGTSTDADLSIDPRSNKQYAMTATDWATGVSRNVYDGYDPIDNYIDIGPSCQQCHGSTRDVEAAFGADTNPVRMSFPHIGANKALLVETNDDFCTNCHAPDILP
ncbi:MAG: hypothetical protein WA118_00615 [Carboxydocellales bacterium]